MSKNIQSWLLGLFAAMFNSQGVEATEQSLEPAAYLTSENYYGFETPTEVWIERKIWVGEIPGLLVRIVPSYEIIKPGLGIDYSGYHGPNETNVFVLTPRIQGISLHDPLRFPARCHVLVLNGIEESSFDNTVLWDDLWHVAWIELYETFDDAQKNAMIDPKH